MTVSAGGRAFFLAVAWVVLLSKVPACEVHATYRIYILHAGLSTLIRVSFQVTDRNCCSDCRANAIPPALVLTSSSSSSSSSLLTGLCSESPTDSEVSFAEPSSSLTLLLFFFFFFGALCKQSCVHIYIDILCQQQLRLSTYIHAYTTGSMINSLRYLRTVYTYMHSTHDFYQNLCHLTLGGGQRGRVTAV